MSNWYSRNKRNGTYQYSTRNETNAYKRGDTFKEEGSFVSARFQSETNSFIIATFQPKKNEEIVCKGDVPGFVIGAPYEIEGEVIDDPTWGIQVKITSATAIRPSSADEIVAFLGSGNIHGIGPRTAKRIYNTFGDDTLDILENDPERLLEIKGIGEKMLSRITEDLEYHLQFRDIIGFFASLGVSTTTTNTLIKHYGKQARDVIEENPYVLCKVRGFAFTRADSIAMKMGFDKTSMKRLYAGCLATLRWICENNGHTVVDRDVLVDEAKKKLSVFDDDLITKALDLLIKDKRIVSTEYGLQLTYLNKAESTIRQMVVQSCKKEHNIVSRQQLDRLIDKTEREKGKTLTEEQRGAIYNAASRRLSILSGTPGGGKAQPVNTRIPTADGWKRLGDLRVGDMVYTSRGMFTQVTDIFDRGMRRTWRVYFEDGRYADCCNEHLWTVVDADDNSGEWRTVELREIIAGLDDISNVNGSIRIPVAMPVTGIRINEVDRNTLVSNAGRRGGTVGEQIAATIKSCEEEHLGAVEITNYLPRLNETIYDLDESQRIAYLRGIAENIGTLDTDNGFHWELRLGYADTDAAYNVPPTTVVYGDERDILGDRETLIDDLLLLARGLGLRARVLTPVGDGSNGASHQLVLEITVFNDDASSDINRRTLGITKIVDTGVDEEMRCIMVDDAEHLYLTDGYIVTHNTSTCAVLAGAMSKAGIDVCLVSPTGRAAKRLSEECGLPAYTIHRALSIMVKEKDDTDFFNEDAVNTFKSKRTNEAVEAFKNAELVLADEASMMDTEMAALLFKACRSKHLVLVGDPNQLPAVGCGQVLRDLMSSSYATGSNGMLTKLTKVFRQKEGSPVIDAAHSIIDGKSPVNIPGITFYECDNDHVQDVIGEKVIPIIKRNAMDYDEFMILSPIKKTKVSGVNALNEFLRPLLNEHYRKPAIESDNEGVTFQRGDFVMQTKNNYECDIFNGDIGRIDSVRGNGDICVDFKGQDDLICFTRQEARENLILAYASTVHKQQGCEANLVVVVCTSSQFSMLNRNLLYTAVTRTKDSLILIGDRKAFAMAAGNKKENSRNTGLRDL